MLRRLLLLFVISASLLAQQQTQTFKITPLKPVPQLQAEALKAQPPAEAGPFRQPDLVELVKLDPTIKLDIHYASDNNFMATPFYSQARAFLQRPAAEALVRANRKLHAQGYGLLIFDGYRPWYVTKMFWDGSRCTLCGPGSRSTCPAATTKCQSAPTPTTPGARSGKMSTVLFCATCWRLRASPSIPASGGTSTTRTGSSIRS